LLTRGEAEEKEASEKMAMSPSRGHGFYDAQSELNRMFDEVFDGRSRRSGQRAAGHAEWVPAIDAFARDGDLVVRAELPSMKPEGVNVTLSQGVLTISGERKESKEEENSGHLVRERQYGSFRRSMSLPEGTDESKIKASFEDGVLQIVIQGGAAEQEEPKKIQIES
jgi:HSP20 family protein